MELIFTIGDPLEIVLISYQESLMEKSLLYESGPLHELMESLIPYNGIILFFKKYSSPYKPWAFSLDNGLLDLLNKASHVLYLSFNLLRANCSLFSPKIEEIKSSPNVQKTFRRLSSIRSKHVQKLVLSLLPEVTPMFL